MKTALYLRLSEADGDLGKDGKEQSNSIRNQRELLRSYCQTNLDNYGTIVEYIDDGYTGTNFNRPGFQRMIEDAKKGKIQMILTKDLSRLGRDYIGVGDYLEQVFPRIGVRYIAVNSHYDSSRYTDMTMDLDMQVSNLVNSLYSKDISRKRRSAFQARWKQGICTSSRLPYGYSRDKSTKGGWKIDPESGAVVRKIFEMACHGTRTNQIAQYLNRKGYLTPGQYREKKEDIHFCHKVPTKERFWDRRMVLFILQEYEYTGASVNHKRETLGVGTGITRAIPWNEQYIAENVHEAIVSAETFYEAQKVIQYFGRPDERTAGDHILRGKVICGNCRLNMLYQPRKYGGYFLCAHKDTIGKISSCSPERYPEELLNRAVYKALRRQVPLILLLRDQMVKTAASDHNQFLQESKTLSKSIELKKAERIRQYEAYSEGVISKEEYIRKKEQLTREIEADLLKIEQTASLTEKMDETDKGLDQLCREVDRNMTGSSLTREMADTFIDSVYVYDSSHVEIVFRFEDILKQAVERYVKKANDTDSYGLFSKEEVG